MESLCTAEVDPSPLGLERMPSVHLPALSMMQPYAWLFSCGLLTVDDRSWATARRGPVAIHASKRFHLAYYEFLRKNTNWTLPEVGAFEAGGIVSVATLTDCLVPVAAGTPLSLNDIHRSHLGASGHCGFVFENPRRVPFVPCRGMPGFFKAPSEIQLVHPLDCHPAAGNSWSPSHAKPK